MARRPALGAILFFKIPASARADFNFHMHRNLHICRPIIIYDYSTTNSYLHSNNRTTTTIKDSYNDNSSLSLNIHTENGKAVDEKEDQKDLNQSGMFRLVYTVDLTC